MDSLQQSLVDAVKAFARANYEMDGWDYIVETMSDEEILELIGGASTTKDAIRQAGQVAKLWDERRKDVEGEVF